jgi:hypothetical protein
MKIDLPIVVIGHSHTYSLKKGIEDNLSEGLFSKDSAEFTIIDASQVSPQISGGYVTQEFLDGFDKNSHFVSMLGGNLHNVFGLIEHPTKFDFFLDRETGGSPDLSREIIPYHLMRLHFENTIKANPINGIKKYKDYFLGKAIHLASPPLIADDDFITATTVYFKDKLHYGIAPDSLRKKLCDLHADVFRSACEEIGLRYVSPPGEALDASGFLLREYWADSTHATRAYGRLLHRQIMEALSP